MTMARIKIKPESKTDWLKLRTLDVTSTEVSALFGISPYLTELELWHQKKNSEYMEIEETDRMRWGTRLEPAIAEGIGEDNGWEVKPFKDYIRVPDLRIGSSFDYIANVNGKVVLLEIKKVDSYIFKQNWVTEKDHAEATPYIELQIQHQMLVAGIETAILGVLVGGNEVKLIKRSADHGIQRAILEKVAQFWRSIDKNQPPAPDFIRDAKFISSLYGYAEPGKVIEAEGPDYDDLTSEYKKLAEDIKDLTDKKEGIKARLLTMIGDAEKVLGDGFTISAGMVGESPISYIRSAYRTFRISFPKKKEKK